MSLESAVTGLRTALNGITGLPDCSLTWRHPDEIERLSLPYLCLELTWVTTQAAGGMNWEPAEKRALVGVYLYQDRTATDALLLDQLRKMALVETAVKGLNTAASGARYLVQRAESLGVSESKGHAAMRLDVLVGNFG